MNAQGLNGDQQVLEPGLDIRLPSFIKASMFTRPRLTIKTALIYVIVVGFLTNQYLLYKLKRINTARITDSSSSTVSTSKPLTSFDQKLVNDQKSNGTEVSVYGSQHIHVDLKVYINNQPLDLARPENYVKARFLHIENNPQSKEDSGSVLHMHAKNVPLEFFFTSIGMNLKKDSLALQDGQILKNENGKRLTFYLDGKKVDELGNYTLQNLDKILISYGSDPDPDITNKVNSVTSYAKNH